MISDFVKNRVAEITTQSEFDSYIDRVKTSKASEWEKEAVMEYAKRQHPQFSPAKRTPTDTLLKEIEAGQADPVKVD